MEVEYEPHLIACPTCGEEVTFVVATDEDGYREIHEEIWPCNCIRPDEEYMLELVNRD